MTDMTLKHTKSPTGRTHALTDPKTGQAVTKHYATTPQYDDQVQGDLIREFSRTIFPVVIGQLPVHIDPDLLDKGQKPHSLEYLRGYLAGLEIARGQGQQRNRDAIEEVREKIARLEAEQNGIAVGWPQRGVPVMTPEERAARRAEAAERDRKALEHAKARRAAQTPEERAADDAERARLRETVPFTLIGFNEAVLQARVDEALAEDLIHTERSRAIKKLAAEHVHTPACDPHFTREDAQAVADRYVAAYPEAMKYTEEQRVALDTHGAEVAEIRTGVFEVWCASHATQLISPNRAYLERRAETHNRNHHPDLKETE